MKTSRILTLAILLSALVTCPAAETFSVAGLRFESPADWKSSQPTSSMRKAQFSVTGDAGEAEVVFFHFGPGQGGGVQANIDRWYGQFQEPRDQIHAKTEKKTVGGIEITYVSAEGTFLSGPPFGQKVPMKGYALLGAIIKNDAGDIFVKMTGPKTVVESADEAFRKMVESAKK